MRIEVIIWLTANAISFLVSARDLYNTHQAWHWARENAMRGETHLVSKRNFRASLFRFALATSFVLAGVIAVVPFGAGWTVWFLVAGAVILTTDILMEARYRGNIFKAASALAKDEHTRSHKRRKEHNHE